MSDGFEEAYFALVKRIGERIAENLEGHLYTDGEDIDLDAHSITTILGDGLHDIVRAIDRLTAAIEKLQAPKGE